MSSGRPQWVYRIVPTRPEMVAEPTEDEVAVIEAHFQYLISLKERGDLILAGRTQEAAGTWGITIFEAADEDAARAMIPHIEAHLAQGGRLHQVTRHMLGLFTGRPGARAWRRILSEEANRPGAGSEVLEKALAAVEGERIAA